MFYVYVCPVHTVPEEAIRPLELELQVVVSRQVSSENGTQVFYKRKCT